MKVSTNLANKYSNVDLLKNGIDEVIARVGAQLGAIEDVEYWAKKFDKATVVKVVSCEKHPNADKLSVCWIDDGAVNSGVDRNSDGLVQVVCGAPNVAAGMLAVWLPPAATVPTTYDTDEPFVLSARELRGVTSNGMMAAPDELGLEGGHEGLLVVENSTPGTSFAEYYGLNDIVLDLENKMFTHRPDCFGVLGVARELAGIQNMPFKSPSWYLDKPQFDELSKENLLLSVQIQTELVPRFMAVAMSGIKVSESPQWLKSALVLSGIRPINNVVDVTNYLMQITGQPLHAYDYDKLVNNSHQGTAILVARQSVKGENVLLLNGKEIQAQDEQMVMIATDSVAVGVAGIMGGGDTEVDENTTKIILECANFDMYNVRRTSMRYGIFTDALTRFNKGQSYLQNDRVLAEAMRMVGELAGGTQASGVKDEHSKGIDLSDSRYTEVSLKAINTLLGHDFTVDEVKQLLGNVEFDVEAISDDILRVQIPFWRTDIALATQAGKNDQANNTANADIAEEVGRLYGYDKINVQLPNRQVAVSPKNQKIEFKNKLRSILASFGANEVLSYSFVHGNLLEKVGQDKAEAFKLANAISPSLQYYRLSLTPSLLEKTTPNIRAGHSEFAIFEIGKAHTKKWLDDDGLPIEAERLGFVLAADNKESKKYGYAPYYKARVFADELFAKLGVEVNYVPFANASPQIVASQLIKPYLAPRSAIITSKNGEFIGVIGEFTKQTQTGLKLPDFCAGFEIDTTQLMQSVDQANKYVPLPKYPSVEQDISLKVDKNVLYADIYQLLYGLIDKNKPKNTKFRFDLIDIYKHGDSKHYAFRLKIASYDKTLKSETVNELLDLVARQANKEIVCERL